MDKERFNKCIEKCIGLETKYNIGTYMEKTVHKVVKDYYCDDKTHQEISLFGCVADICKDKEIIEIQTKAFSKLKNKLDKYPSDYNITIVYPIPHVKTIYWLDPKTMEIVDKRKSPKKGNIFSAFKELYTIKDYLAKPNISITILLFDCIEYKKLNKKGTKRRGTEREDIIPTELYDEIRINDYHMFLPTELNEFSAVEYSKKVGCRIDIARRIINILIILNIVRFDHKDGRKYIYKRI